MVERVSPRQRLGYRLLVWILAGSAVLSVLNAAIQLRSERQWSVSTLDARLAQLETTYAPSLTNSLWSFDERQLQHLLQGIHQLPDIRYVEVATTYGERYSVGEPPAPGEELRTRAFILRHVNGRTIELGSVHVVATFQDLHARLRQRFFLILGTQVVHTFLAGLLLFILFQYLVTRHLNALAGYARSLRLDGLDKPLVLREGRRFQLPPNELDEVARALNDMRLSLRAQIDERRRAEDKVQFLAEASKELAASLDPRDVSDSVCTLALRRLAGMAVCFVTQPSGALELKSLKASNPAKLPLAERLFRLTPEPYERRQVLLALGFEEALPVPLEARGRSLGVLLLLREATAANGKEPIDEELVAEFALRASAALDNALLFRDAQSAVQLRDEFLTIASHELNTPLTNLRIYVQLLTRVGTRVQDPEAFRQLVRKTSQRLERQVDRLQQLVRSVLDVTEVQAGHLVLHREELELTDVVRAAMDTNVHALQRAGCTVRLTVEGDVSGQWDRVGLAKVTDSLLSNAMKFGVGRPIDIRLIGRDGIRVLEVMDRGVGIPPENQHRIFDRFTRGVSQRHYGGMGLGLYIAQQIVEAHGGTIQVESSVGEGATFRVILPAVPFAELGLQSTPPASPSPSPSSQV